MAVFFPFEIVRQIEYILSHHMPTLDLTQSATCIRFSVAVGSIIWSVFLCSSGENYKLYILATREWGP